MVITCLSNRLRKAMAGALISAGFNDDGTLRALQAFPECEIGDLKVEQEKRTEKGEIKAKRPRSAYQNFISECMKAKHIKGFGNAAPAMKECAAQWKSRKG